MNYSRPEITSNQLILLVSLFMVATGNVSFFANVLKVYLPAFDNLAALLSLVIVLYLVTLILVAPLCIGRTTRPMLMACLVFTAICATFMDSYGIVINDEMLRNAAQTNTSEALDLLNAKLFIYLFFLGVLPSVLVGRVNLREQGHWRSIRSRLTMMGLALVILVATVLTFGSFYSSFLREHKPLRSFANPAYPIYSAIKFAGELFEQPNDGKVKAIGLDASIPSTDKHRELVVLVVGETARADHFSLNGYPRETNPQLRQLDVINLENFSACGTSTAVSVPCMFSLFGSLRSSDGIEGLLDVVQRAGVNVLWLDNNSDSKGAALRVPYVDYKTPTVNPICDVECRDEGMLSPLQDYINRHPSGDILIVLHQMGNHGPAYYKRYPPAFERFTPVCHSNDLSRCTNAEIINAYDNAILYTDYFLSKVIALLKANENYETAMFYVSDHGESLGEGGTYLHGLPRAIAPAAQLHVPAILWFGSGFDELDRPALARKRSTSFSHDNLFHTILGFFEIDTIIYRPDLDILDGSRTQGHD
jgi:lipid A ethanolaminephosphotransferase